MAGSAERICQRRGDQVEAFFEQLPTPKADEEGKILVQSIDRKGVPLIQPHTEEPPVFVPSDEIGDSVGVVDFVRDGAETVFGRDAGQPVAVVPAVFDHLAGRDVGLGSSVVFVVVGVIKRPLGTDLVVVAGHVSVAGAIAVSILSVRFVVRTVDFGRELRAASEGVVRGNELRGELTARTIGVGKDGFDLSPQIIVLVGRDTAVGVGFTDQAAKFVVNERAAESAQRPRAIGIRSGD